MSESQKRLYRSKKDRVIAGIGGGLGKYFDIDPIWVRLIIVVLVFLDGIGVLLYIAAWFLIPEEPSKDPKKEKKDTKKTKKLSTAKPKKEIVVDQSQNNGALFVGAILIVLGVLFLLKNFFWWLNFAYIWPALLIIVGMILLARGNKNE